MVRHVEVGVLGPVRATVDGRPAVLGGPQQRRLLAALAIDGGAIVPPDVLVDRVWADGRLPDDPRRTLRTYLTRLRRALGGEGAVTTESTGWRLDPSTVAIDARRFEELLVSAAEPGLDVHDRLGHLDRGLGLWRGHAREEVADDEWARTEADRLEELRLTATERRFEAMVAAGMHTDAGGATLWDLETLDPVGDPFPYVTDFRHPSLAAEAKLLATTTGTEAVIWNVDVDTWPDIACRAAGRNMTTDEWEQFGPAGEPYRPTCDRWPALG